MSFRFWVAVVFEGRNVKQMETDFYYAWHLWYARNARLWRQDVIGLARCKVEAEVLLEEWSKAPFMGDDGMHVHKTQCTHTSWEKPPMGHVKLNVDVVVLRDGCCIGGGVVAQDHTGKVLGCFFEKNKWYVQNLSSYDYGLLWTILLYDDSLMLRKK